MKLIIIASGSKANAAVIENNGQMLLVDCGVTFKALSAGLESAGLTVQSLCGVLVTHSHSDHTKGLSVLSRRVSVPFRSAVPIDGCELFEGSVSLGCFEVQSFSCSHDVPCVGYKIRCDGKQVCFATDTGVVTPSMREALYGCETAVLESNHDTDMLNGGFYPPQLKARISSDKGHLSNTECAKLVTYLAGGGLKRAVLAHLSENNNTPLLARAETEKYLKRYALDGVSVCVADSGLVLEL